MSSGKTLNKHALSAARENHADNYPSASVDNRLLTDTGISMNDN